MALTSMAVAIKIWSDSDKLTPKLTGPLFGVFPALLQNV
jgi:hypothetical protein